MRIRIRLFGHYEVRVGESGWPSGGQTIGDAVPSLPNAASYFLNFVSWARAKNVPYFYFEAYDEAWKAKQEGPQGGAWGIFDASGNLKSGMSDVFSGKTVPDNWTFGGVIGGPGTPVIQFTSIPSRSSSDSVKGQVLHVDPTNYYVAVYIRVRGGWWTKPYWSTPKTEINADGTWSCNVFTGGVDTEADEIAAFLMPNSYSNLPLASGESSIPGGVPANAAAQIVASR